MENTDKTLQVLIADSQFLIIESLKILLQNDERFVVNKVVTEKNELIESLNLRSSSLLIIDPALTDFEGFTELKEILSRFPELKVLVISNNISKRELQEYNSVGITSVVLKTAGKEEITEALNAAINGKKYYSNELLDLLFEKDERKSSVAETSQLTNAEAEIVRLIAEGLTTKEIAARKFISFHTVISHRKNIFRKLGVTSISELIMYSIKAGLINTIEYNI